jgi:hypothetical protein
VHVTQQHPCARLNHCCFLVAVQRPSSQPGEEEQWQVTWCATPPSSSKPSRLAGGKGSKVPAEGLSAGVAAAAGDGPGGSGVRSLGQHHLQQQPQQQLLHRRKLSGASFNSSGSKLGTGGVPGSTSSSSAPGAASAAAVAAAQAMQQLLAELGGAGSVDTPPGGFKTPAGPKLRLR